MATKPMVFLMVPMFTCTNALKHYPDREDFDDFLSSVKECKPEAIQDM